MMAVSQTQFAAIVGEVAAGISELEEYDVSGFHVLNAAIRSRSGKSRWYGHLAFDPETGNYQVTAPHGFAGGIASLAVGVRDAIRAANGN
jgi:hypothetical protein